MLKLPRHITVFDTETTGLTKDDYIVAFGYAHIDLVDCKVVDSGEVFSDPQLVGKALDNYIKGAYKVTGINLPNMECCTNPDKFLPQEVLCHFIIDVFKVNRNILAHNMKYDSMMVNSLFNRHGYANLSSDSLGMFCSLENVRKHCNYKSNKLDDLIRIYKAGDGVDRTLHGALKDTLLLSNVLFKMKESGYLVVDTTSRG